MFDVIYLILMVWTFFGGIIFAVILDFPRFVENHKTFIVFISGPAIWFTALFIYLINLKNSKRP